MRITEVKGDLFDAPEGATLIHACNCVGSWGGGIAQAFRSKYPGAYKVYMDHCKNLKNNVEMHTIIDTQTNERRVLKEPLGTALIIPPQEEDIAKPRKGSPRSGKRHWIVCLFTSHHFGRAVSPPDVILENSVHAIRDMRRQIEALRQVGEDIASDGKMYSCRFNSGLFHVEWIDTKAVLGNEMGGQDAVQEIIVVRPESEQ